MQLKDYIGEPTAYDKKLMLERKDPASWLKSVSAFIHRDYLELVYAFRDRLKKMELRQSLTDDAYSSLLTLSRRKENDLKGTKK